MHDKIGLEDKNLFKHFAILYLEFPSGLGLLIIKILSSIFLLMFIFHNRPRAKISCPCVIYGIFVRRQSEFTIHLCSLLVRDVLKSSASFLSLLFSYVI